MKKSKPPYISQEDWDSVDNPPLTKAWFRRARPAREVDPELVAAYRRGDLRYRGQRGPQKQPTKKLVSIRLSQEVLRHFKATGEGWQTRLDAALRLLIGAE
jgi:uncharacterized protein (DUF4415 family)